MTSDWLLHSNADVVLNTGENTACTLDNTHWGTACQVQGYCGLLGREERRVPRSPVSSEVGDPRLLEGVEKGGRADKARRGGVPSGFASSVSAKSGGRESECSSGAGRVLRWKPEPRLNYL